MDILRLAHNKMLRLMNKINHSIKRERVDKNSIEIETYSFTKKKYFLWATPHLTSTVHCIHCKLLNKTLGTNPFIRNYTQCSIPIYRDWTSSLTLNLPMFKNFCVCCAWGSCEEAGVGCGGPAAVAAVLKAAAGVTLLGSVAEGRLRKVQRGLIPSGQIKKFPG